MRYIIVNGRKCVLDGYCAFCNLNLTHTYLREISTGLVYHSPFCYEMHFLSMQKFVEDMRERSI